MAQPNTRLCIGTASSLTGTPSGIAVVRAVGLEPTRPKAPDFKSGLATGFSKRAQRSHASGLPFRQPEPPLIERCPDKLDRLLEPALADDRLGRGPSAAHLWGI